MRLAILGGGTIARLVVEHVRAGRLKGIEVIAIAGRSAQSRGVRLAAEFRLPYVIGGDALLALRPEAVLEAASHDAVRAHLVALLAAGISVVVLSAGALADDALRASSPRGPHCSRVRRVPRRSASA